MQGNVQSNRTQYFNVIYRLVTTEESMKNNRKDAVEAEGACADWGNWR